MNKLFCDVCEAQIQDGASFMAIQVQESVEHNGHGHPKTTYDGLTATISKFPLPAKPITLAICSQCADKPFSLNALVKDRTGDENEVRYIG